MNLDRLLAKYELLCSVEDGGGIAPSGGGAASSSSTPQGTPPSSTPSTPSSASPSSVPAGGGPPAQDTPATPASDGGEVSSDWSSIFEGSPQPEAEGIVQPPPVAAQPPAPPVVPPVQPAAAPPVAPTEAPRTPEAATPPEPATPVLDRYDPGMLASHLARNEAQALEYVANNVFKLTPQDVEALETNVVEAIPRLLARVFVKSQQNVLSQLATMVPTMIQRQTVAMQKNNENADKFYAKWPMIKKAEHGDLVNKYGAVYRQMHPQASLEQMIEDLGPMVMMAGRIPLQAPAPVMPSGQPVNPAAQRAAGNGRSPQPSPFVPAGSAAPTSTSAAPEISPWEAMFRQE